MGSSPEKGENIKNRPWISIEDELPPGERCCVEIACHNDYGFANWSKEEGFYEVFTTCGPYEEAEHYKGDAYNHEVMWWRPICNWPYYGTKGTDSPLMHDIIDKNEKPQDLEEILGD